jgi:hypothetical protein
MFPSRVWMLNPSFFESVRWYPSLICITPTSFGVSSPRSTLPYLSVCLKRDSQRAMSIMIGRSAKYSSTCSFVVKVLSSLASVCATDASFAGAKVADVPKLLNPEITVSNPRVVSCKIRFKVISNSVVSEKIKTQHLSESYIQ